jgi:ankyrin repeat protein
MHLAVSEKRIDVLKVLLEHDSSLGYLISPPLLCVAAIVGAVGVARELLKHCPDAPYCDPKGSTCLHIAVLCGHMEYVKFILGSQQLGQLVNMQNSRGETALHLAAKFKKVEMLSALRHRQDMDITVLNSAGKSANWELLHATNPAKPLISVCILCPHLTVINWRKKYAGEKKDKSLFCMS